MESLAALRRPATRPPRRLQLLLGAGDAGLRSVFAARACELVDSLVVVEAGDGGEAIQIGLQREVQLALLDVNMPRLGGIEVAMTLRELRPQMRIALQTTEPLIHRERARAYRLPLFDKLELERVIGWLELQAHSLGDSRVLQQKSSLVCTACGYGIARLTPPDRCPMCQREDTWADSPRRTYAADRRVA